MAAHSTSPSQPRPDPAGGAATMQILASGAAQLGWPLSAAQLAQFERFYQELVTWNDKFNLTAITDYDGVQTRHFLDCLAGLPLLAEAWRTPPLTTRTARALDVGTGAGFPGVPLKIVLPHLHWTLMDGTGKKIVFLRNLVTQLALQEVTVVQGRAEELGRQATFRQQFDLVTARAVAPLNTLVEYLLPLAGVGGLVMVYKGASAPQEFMAARRAIELLGGEPVRLAPVQVPLLDEKRFILLLKKVRPTPPQYPRGQGLARKKPIEP